MDKEIAGNPLGWITKSAGCFSCLDMAKVFAVV
jgi:hypothetical protein